MGQSQGGSGGLLQDIQFDRGQTNVIGLAILIGFSLVVMSVAVVHGSSLVREAQASAEVDLAEQAMSKLDSEASFTALGSSDHRDVDLPLEQEDATLTLDETAGWMNVSIRNSTDNTVRVLVLNETLGAIVYENTARDVSIAFQGGGVWRDDDTGSVMVSPPEFHYRTDGGDPTLTLPLVVVNGTGTIDGDVRIEQLKPTVEKFPVSGDVDRTNPLTDGEVNITIKSEYYRAWGRYFEDRTDGRVTYDHERDLAMITLVIPADNGMRSISGAIASTATGEAMSLQGSGGAPAYVDSYNSSVGPYSTSQSDNGTVTLAGDLDMAGNAEVHGDIRSGAHVDLSGSSIVNGWVYWTTGFSAGGGASFDGKEQIDGVDSAGSSTTRVLQTLDDLNGSNDNAFADDITDESFDSGDVRLNATGGGDDGRSYYLGDDTVLSGEQLTLNTTDGPVTLGIDGDLTLEKSGGGANITVVGDHTAEIWVSGDLQIKKAGTVHVPDDRAERLWLYATGTSAITIEGSNSQPANFTGVIYAPRGSGEDGDTIVKHGNVWGALVVGQVDVGAYGDVHYDKALSDDRAFNTTVGKDAVPQITYLHISVNEVTVTDA